MISKEKIIIRPVVSEKSFELAKKQQYTFVVGRETTKDQVKEAIERIYGVTVLAVRILNRKGKRVNYGRKRNVGRRQLRRIAYVTLKEGDKIDVFDLAK